MPMIRVCLSEDDYRDLLLMAQERGRAIEDLAEAAIENAIMEARPRARREPDYDHRTVNTPTNFFNPVR